jgi:hypothetical protein
MTTAVPLPLLQVKPAFQQSETLMSDIWWATRWLYGWSFRHWSTRMAPKLRPALLRNLEQHQLEDALKKRQEAAAAGAHLVLMSKPAANGDPRAVGLGFDLRVRLSGRLRFRRRRHQAQLCR